MPLDDTYRPDFPAPEAFVEFWTIIEVHTEADPPYAVGQLPDGTEKPIYPVQGYLPAVGDYCPAMRNGGDPIIIPARWMADGSMQSLNYDPGLDGWIITADGDCEFNSGTFRADITGALFRTATTGARVEIDSVNEQDQIRFYSGDDDEIAPGTIRAYTDLTEATLELVSPEFPAGGEDVHAIVRVGIDLDSGETFADVVADNIRSNGVSISKPPYSSKRRVADFGPVSSSDTDFAFILFDKDRLVNWNSFIEYQEGTGEFYLYRPGIYDGHLIWSWHDDADLIGLPAATGGSRVVSISEQGTRRTLDTMPAVVTRNTVHNAYFDTIAPATTDETNPWIIRFSCSQENGPAIDLYANGRVTVKRFSD